MKDDVSKLSSCSVTAEDNRNDLILGDCVRDRFFFPFPESLTCELSLFYLIGNNRYDNNDGGESNFLKRPPPKNTLMDFMTSLKISNDNENEKPKEHNTKRQYNGNNQSHYSLNNDQIIFEQDSIDEQLNPEDDPSHANYRERRNPLPPRYIISLFQINK